MKNAKLSLFHVVMSFSLLIFSASAQKGATYPADVEGITLLLSTFPALGRNGTFDPSPDDPCLPTPYPWITCSSDDTPRITALNCDGTKLSQKLYGILLDFSSMDALEIIDFSNNLLVQEFPDFLAKFTELEVLNLANNTLIGTVPTSLQKNKNLKLTLTGNKLLCFSDKDVCGPAEYIEGTGIGKTPTIPGIPAVPGVPGANEGSRKNSLQIILGTAFSISVMLWVIV